MEKTPVMLLQETGMKIGYMPKYFEIINNAPSTQITFGYRVTVDQLTAYGYALSKKHAKHAAASAMLQKLLEAELVPACFTKDIAALVSKEQSPEIAPQVNTGVDLDVQIPSSNKTDPSCTISDEMQQSKYNYVGKLQEKCMQFNLDMPKYITTNITGPPHKQQFTIECSVGDISKTATALTKKVAKQNAAREVLQHITIEKKGERKESVEGASDIPLKELRLKMSNMSLEELKHTDEEKKKIIQRYMKVKPYNHFQKYTSEEPCSITEYHSRLEILCSSALLHLRNEMDYLNQGIENEMIGLIKNLIEQAFKKQLEIIKFTVKEQGLFIVGMRLNTTPVLFDVGRGKTEQQAEINSMYNLLKLILSFHKNAAKQRV